jgi:hypothetical protein
MNLSDNEFMRNMFILVFLINLFGILGSVVTFLIYSRKVFAKSSFRIYFKSLSFFDMFVGFYVGSSLASLILDHDLINESDAVCKLFYFVTVGTSPNPGWVLVLYSIDQLIRVSMSKRFTFIKKRAFQFKIMGVMCLWHILTAVYVIKQVEVKEIDLGNNSTANRCEYPMSQIALPVFFFFESSLIPFAVMLLTTILILKYLYESKVSLQKYDSTDKMGNLLNSSATSSNTPSRPPKVTVNKRRDFKYAFNSVVFNVVFIVFTFPGIFVHLAFGRYSDNVVLTNIRVFFFILFCSNFALHFWIHFFVNAIFRKEIFRLLGFNR